MLTIIHRKADGTEIKRDDALAFFRDEDAFIVKWNDESRTRYPVTNKSEELVVIRGDSIVVTHSL